MLACVATWQERTGSAPTTEASTGTSGAPASPTPASTSLPPPEHARRPPGPYSLLDQLLAGFTDEQRALFDQVRRWRGRTAHGEGAPAYVVLTNRQLVEIVLQRPRSTARLDAVHGLGARSRTDLEAPRRKQASGPRPLPRRL